MDRLRKIEALAEQMLELADLDEPVADVRYGILLGTLRDCGYRLRQLARDQLSELPAGVLTDERPRSSAVHAPVERGPSEQEASVTTPKLGASDRRVLIVDDDPDVVTYLETWFQDRGFETLAAADGAEALRRARDVAPDLITLDVTMPDESGTQVFRRLSEDPELRRIPVIVITAMSSPTRTAFATPDQLSAPDGFLVKPIDMRRLARLVRRLLGPLPASPSPPLPGRKNPPDTTRLATPPLESTQR